MDFETRILAGGKWMDARGGSTFVSISPADEKDLAQVASGTKEDIDTAVLAASEALVGPWSKTSGWERARLLYRLAELVERDTEILAHLEAVEIGRPISEPRNVDIPSAVACLRTYAAFAERVNGKQIPGPDHFGRQLTTVVVREPIGVVAAILPWNAPTMIATWKLGPILATGCTCVLKPAEDASLAVLHLGRLVLEAGYPDGVVNIVPGRGDQVGQHLVTHPRVDKVSFTGSPQVGSQIAIWCAPLFRPTTLELGGKSAQIVMSDADIEGAVPGIALGVFSNQGQICAAGSRILVHRSIQDRVAELLAHEARSRKLGDPLDPSTTMGSLVSRKQLDSVMRYIALGKSEGARVLAGGEKLERPGFFVQPTVFDNVSNDATIAREEIFGPVATIIPFDTPEEALLLANSSDYGLSANVWTGNVKHAHQLAHGLKVGTVWVNGGGTPDPRTGWGGGGKSGVGRELGEAGILSHTTEKTLNFFY
ncbi:aldehyde dehydrogenase family protein [Rhizobium pusense]|uniref:Aldehyde dehydrogenase DhaS n=4 Tax=Agrobacterium TaxID=357 RepID=A0A9W5B8J1_9HYPH|nr:MULTISPECIES: aldehyde dehydrogenase family protein [Rhizobium/Agrobacterium group]MDH0912488.1 aldehyde dehydrogenase family protein [Agrobacterium pusense]MCD4663577.1 aldehyde dehydrogenase family protein [Agrobacterium sp.]MDH1099053.1 aldehyde dehydrogenase family protein [Agrobacterium pusense]MDH1115134.1 aldehyde dehydrogenase family protein [Agrobacterium pusense]MDH2196940.1 aldehyde dehydrogenase family protein [Agrobacterium pusense]